MQNSDFWTRITSLYGSQTSPIAFGIQNSNIITTINMSLWVRALICGFVHSQQRHYDHILWCLWVPDLTCRFVHAKQRD